MVTDDDAGTTTVLDTVDIQIVSLQSGGNLAVGGTNAGDKIRFHSGEQPGDTEVLFNGASLGVFQATNRLMAFGQAGNDDIQLAGSIGLPAWLYGGDGDDRLKGGAGHDALFGENGDDLLAGQSGRDLLIGGFGADRIVGNSDDDILIAGYTSFERDSGGQLLRSHEQTLLEIFAEWTSERDLYVRVANLFDGSSSADRENAGTYLKTGDDDATIFDDDERDVMTGSAGDDWIFFDDSKDRATDLKDEVFANDLDFLLP